MSLNPGLKRIATSTGKPDQRQRDNKKFIEDLKTQILVDDDKVLFEEASQCFLNGQLRAAYILSLIHI